MIKKCEQLLAGLLESLKLAQEIQKTTGTHNMDVMHIGLAIETVKARIRYLTNLVEPKAEKPKAENSEPLEPAENSPAKLPEEKQE